MSLTVSPSTDDPLTHIGDMRHEPATAAGYLIELLDSAALLALAADLPNSSAMLSACAKLVEQECLNVTKRAPIPPGED